MSTVAVTFSLSTTCITRSIKEPTIILESSLYTDFCVKILVKMFQGSDKEIAPQPLTSTIDSK